MRLVAKLRPNLNETDSPAAVLAADRLKGAIEKRRMSETIRLAVVVACRERGGFRMTQIPSKKIEF